METHRAYCSAVDRVVPVTLKAGAAPRDRVSLLDPGDLICLDYKVRCTGWCCPLFSVEDDSDRAAGLAAGDAVLNSHAAARPAPPKPPQTKSRWTRRT